MRWRIAASASGAGRARSGLEQHPAPQLRVRNGRGAQAEARQNLRAKAHYFLLLSSRRSRPHHLLSGVLPVWKPDGVQIIQRFQHGGRRTSTQSHGVLEVMACIRRTDLYGDEWDVGHAQLRIDINGRAPQPAFCSRHPRVNERCAGSHRVSKLLGRVAARYLLNDEGDRHRSRFEVDLVTTVAR